MTKTRTTATITQDLTKKSDGPGGRLLRISEAARYIGKSVDTLRARVRDGRLRAELSPGGQYLFTVEDLDAVAGRKGEGSSLHLDEIVEHMASQEPVQPVVERSSRQRRLRLVRQPSGSPVPAGEALPSLAQRRIENAQADVQIARSRPDVLEARYKLKDMESARAAKEQRERREMVAEKERQEESSRLEGIRADGRLYVRNQPAEWQAAVVKDLEGSVNSQQFPPSLPGWQAQQFVQARVDQILAPFNKAKREQWEREQVERSRQWERQRQEQEFQNRLTSARSHASSKSLGWNLDAFREAAKAVKEALEQDAEPGWSQQELNDLVDEVLSEWE